MEIYNIFVTKMKHLLTLLLFISTSVMAEKFNLVCEVKKELFFDDYAPVSSDDILGVIVHDDFIKVNDFIFNNKNTEINGKIISSFYTKNQQTISFQFHAIHNIDDNNDLRNASYDGEIDRLTGKISYRLITASLRTHYSGYCKKSEKAF